MFESTGLMEPMLPTPSRELEDLIIEMIQKASTLTSQIPNIVQKTIGELVRSMNCYYSNLIEGHHTHPYDIERALKKEYSQEIEKRNLQLEAVAHIEVQKLIDEKKDPKVYPLSSEYIQWLHREFCSRFPEDLLFIENPSSGEKVKIHPGEFRDRTVRVGVHIPPLPENIPQFMKRLEESYNPIHLSKIQRILAVAASHHRLVWIHPFLDGNGRTTRMVSYSALLTEQIGNPLWSVARGLARNIQEYKRLLMEADENRKGDLDGRGTLSEKTLSNFCVFFFKTCIDQIDYMSSLLKLNEFVRRIERYTQEEVLNKKLPNGSFSILREALIMGEVERKKIPQITGYKERMARETVSILLHRGLLTSIHHKDKLRLGLPLHAVESYFPGLYPDLNTLK